MECFPLGKGWEVSDKKPVPEAAKLAIRWFESKQNEVAAEVADFFSKYRLSEALMAVYKLFWDEFSSWYLEMIKPAYGQPINRRFDTCYLVSLIICCICFIRSCRFITEELWQQMYERRGEGESILMVDRMSMDTVVDSEMIQEFEVVKEVISNVRSIRLQRTLPKRKHWNCRWLVRIRLRHSMRLL